MFAIYMRPAARSTISTTAKPGLRAERHDALNRLAGAWISTYFTPAEIPFTERFKTPSWATRFARKTSSPSSTAWTWTSPKTSAHPIWPRSTSIATAWRVPWAVSPSKCSGWTSFRPICLGASPRRVPYYQHPARSRRCFDRRLYLSREHLGCWQASRWQLGPGRSDQRSAHRRRLPRDRHARPRALPGSGKDHGCAPQGAYPHTAPDGRGLCRDPAPHGSAGWAPPCIASASQPRPRDARTSSRIGRPKDRMFHVVGAGLAGLSRLLCAGDGAAQM